jgi:general secretion pathway protein N
MRRTRLLVAAGFAAFFVFLVAFLPASLLLRYVPAEVALSGVSGTIWRGSAASVNVKGTPIGSLGWSNRPWRLLVAELQYGLDLQPAGGSVRMTVTAGRNGRIDLERIEGAFPVELVSGLVAPESWKGTVELDVNRVAIRSGLLDSAAGVIVVRDLTDARSGGINIGSFELTLGEGAVGSESIAGRLRDLGGGPMRVRATLEIGHDLGYLINGDVAATPAAGPRVLRALSALPPPDSLGRRPFAIEGSV